MALSGVHYAGYFIGGHGVGQDTLPIPSEANWSETNNVQTTPSLSVVAGSDLTFSGRPMVRINASANCYVSMAKSPNPAASPRAFIRAGVTYDYLVKEGDRFAWLAEAAFTGCFFSACFIGGHGVGKDMLPVPSQPVWSENPASGVVSANVIAGSDAVFKGRPMVRITAAADSYVSIGRQPNASTGTRHFLTALTDYDFFVKQGDRFAWIAA